MQRRQFVRLLAGAPQPDPRDEEAFRIRGEIIKTIFDRYITDPSIVDLGLGPLFDRYEAALRAAPAEEPRGDEVAELKAAMAEMCRRLEAGTLHVPYCNGDHRRPVGDPGMICNCPMGRTIKSLRAERDAALAGRSRAPDVPWCQVCGREVRSIYCDECRRALAGGGADRTTVEAARQNLEVEISACVRRGGMRAGLVDGAIALLIGAVEDAVRAEVQADAAGRSRAAEPTEEQIEAGARALHASLVADAGEEVRGRFAWEQAGTMRDTYREMSAMVLRAALRPAPKKDAP